MSNNKKAYIYAILAVFFWSLSFTGVKYVLSYYSPEAIMLFRFLIASLSIAIVAKINGVKLPDKADYVSFLSMGFIGIFAYMWLFNTGTKMVLSGISSFIIAAVPAFTAVLAAIFLKEKISSKIIFGIGISGIGIIIIAVSQLQGVKFNMGVLMLLAAACATAIYNIMQRKMLAKYSAIATTTYSILSGTIFMLVFSKHLITEFPNAPLSANIIIVALGVFPGALSYLFWSLAIANIDKISRVASAMYLNPFLATFYGYILLHEVVSPLAFFGGILIILGLIISNRR